jgi:hypothetical protein
VQKTISGGPRLQAQIRKMIAGLDEGYLNSHILILALVAIVIKFTTSDLADHCMHDVH